MILSSNARARAAFLAAFVAVAIVPVLSSSKADARPVSKSKKGGSAAPLNFLRQLNVYSNLEFFYTNRGVLFNAGQGENEGLFWPRGSNQSYLFGEGLWFATKKEIQGKRRKLCDLGYNPNSGAGWYMEGEASQVGLSTGTDGATPAAKYISYVSPRYDKLTGAYISGSSSVVPSPYYPWPLWDTASGKTLYHNFYFGDYISDVGTRNTLVTEAKGGNTSVKPAITSEEDIFNVYTDQDPTNNPEFRAGTGYPFGIDVQEEIYSWSFGRYRDMIFLRQKVTNSSGDSLIDCYMAPAFDPDLDAAVGGANNDANSYVTDSLVKTTADAASVQELREPYRSDPAKLNMGVQWRNYTQAPNGKQYGWIGFSFLESPVIDASGNIIANDDSAGLGGYGPNSLFQKNQLGLTTFRDWIILNDPSTQDLRYDFVASGEKDLFNGVYQDQRLLMSTGPFTLPPHKSVETTVAIGIAQVDNTDYHKNFGALLLLMDFAHQVFGEVDSSVLSVMPDTTGKLDTTYAYSVSHFLSPVPPDIPNIKTTALDRAVLVTWDSTSEKSIDAVSGLYGAPDSLRAKATLPFMGYQLWRTTRKDHDSTIRPDGNNPDVMLGDWHLYDFAKDSVFDANGHFNRFHYRRLNSTPHPIPHSYLDVGDDNHDGVLTGTEGLYNGVQYYYYVIAYDEFDSINKIGPLYTAIVPPKNFVVGIPNRPVLLAPFTSDTASGIAGNCLAGSGDIGPNFGGLQDVRLDIVDTGIFEKLFTNDTIHVSFQPRWVELTTNVLNQSYMLTYVDVTDSRKGPDGQPLVQNTYSTMQSAANNTNAYFFPTTLPGAITLHVNGTITPDSVFASQFTTDNTGFAPNQTIAQALKVLADVNFEQLSTPYRLHSVTVTPGPSNPTLDKDILRLSRRTNNGADGDTNQSIWSLPTDEALNNGQGSTRPSFLGALGETSYDITFGPTISPGPVPVVLPSGDVIHPRVMPIQVSLTNCPEAILRLVQDTTANMTIEYDHRFYSDVGSPQGSTTLFPKFDDPDVMHVPNPGWYTMQAFHYVDQAGFDQQHTNASFASQPTTAPTAFASGASVGAYYFPIGGNDNIDQGQYHLVVHKLSVAGAELIFNAPEISDPNTGDTIAGTGSHVNPHMNDFQPGDKITLSFTGLMKNVPFPGAQFNIVTESGSKVDFSNAGNYTDSMLSQVQVVPNPYIVTHLGQTSTDNAKLFFTRLPPRCTIEIYALDGTLVNTIEHIGYASSTTQNPNNPAQTTTTYDYSQLSDQSSVETWNLLTAGKQRVGSQVLFAHIIARDPITNAETGETTTKFAIVVGVSK